jgi:hypothetical protein
MDNFKTGSLVADKAGLVVSHVGVEFLSFLITTGQFSELVSQS